MRMWPIVLSVLFVAVEAGLRRIGRRQFVVTVDLSQPLRPTRTLVARISDYSAR